MSEVVSNKMHQDSGLLPKHMFFRNKSHLQGSQLPRLFRDNTVAFTIGNPHNCLMSFRNFSFIPRTERKNKKNELYEFNYRLSI